MPSPSPSTANQKRWSLARRSDRWWRRRARSVDEGHALAGDQRPAHDLDREQLRPERPRIQLDVAGAGLERGVAGRIGVLDLRRAPAPEGRHLQEDRAVAARCREGPPRRPAGSARAVGLHLRPDPPAWARARRARRRPRGCASPPGRPRSMLGDVELGGGRHVRRARAPRPASRPPGFSAPSGAGSPQASAASATPAASVTIRQVGRKQGLRCRSESARIAAAARCLQFGIAVFRRGMRRPGTAQGAPCARRRPGTSGACGSLQGHGMREAMREDGVVIRQQPWITYALLLLLLSSFAYLRAERSQIDAELGRRARRGGRVLPRPSLSDFAGAARDARSARPQAEQMRVRFLDDQRSRNALPVPAGIQRREQERLDDLVGEAAGRALGAPDTALGHAGRRASAADAAQPRSPARELAASAREPLRAADAGLLPGGILGQLALHGRRGRLGGRRRERLRRAGDARRRDLDRQLGPARRAARRLRGPLRRGLARSRARAGVRDGLRCSSPCRC